MINRVIKRYCLIKELRGEITRQFYEPVTIKKTGNLKIFEEWKHLSLLK